MVFPFSAGISSVENFRREGEILRDKSLLFPSFLISFAVFLLALQISFLYGFWRGREAIIPSWFLVSPRKERVEFPYYVPLSFADPERKVFLIQAELSKSDLSEFREPVFVVSNIFAQAFEVSVNGRVIGKVGDMEKGNSNIWNRAFLFTLPGKEGGVITIRALSLFDFGLNGAPFLAEGNIARIFVRSYNFFASDFVLMEMGIILAIGFILFGIAFSSGISFYRNMGIAFILAFLGQMDTLFIEKLPFPLIAFRKLVDLSFYFAMIVWYSSMRKFLKVEGSFLSYFLKEVLFSALLVALAFVWDLRELNLFGAFFMMLFLPLAIDAILFSARKFSSAPSICLANVFTSITALVNIAIYLLGFFGKALIPYFHVINVGAFVMGACVGVEIIRDFASISGDLRKLREESRKDKLTGAYNRSALSSLGRELDGDSIISVMFVDIDDLKGINDKYGHDVGDSVIVKVAEIIRGRIRKGDLLIRYGGDEFVVVLKECASEDALGIAEKIVEEVREYAFSLDEGFKVGVSIGVSSFRADEELSSSLKKADKALYSAKRRGKGKAVLME